MAQIRLACTHTISKFELNNIRVSNFDEVIEGLLKDKLREAIVQNFDKLPVVITRTENAIHDAIDFKIETYIGRDDLHENKRV